MSDGSLHGVVVAHGELAAALVAETERISGQTGVLRSVSNTGCGPEQIEERVRGAVGAGPAVLFVDMPCGSCFFAAMRVGRERSDVRVVTGVNLPMLIKACQIRTKPLSEVARVVCAQGRESVQVAGDLLSPARP